MGPTDILNMLRTDANLTALVPAESIKAFSIPPEWVRDGKVPRLLITEVSAPFVRFGGDHARGRRKLEQVQGWFEPAEDIDAVQKAVNEAMENSQWFNSYDGGIDQDPDTSELFFTMQFVKNQLGV